MADKLLIVHGYSDGSTSFTGLRDFFVAQGAYRRENVFFTDYSSMDDEATFRDFADKLDTDYHARFRGERIDVACHSTGSLVVRAWLALHSERTRRRGTPEPCPAHRLLCFAPANFGSDLAALGQSFLGKFRSTFFNSNARPEDFMESGKQVLQGLEPASPFQWELSLLDLHGEHTYFSPRRQESERCYPFVLAAGTGYAGLEAQIIKKRAMPGTDGTVRIAGTSLNTRMCTLDFLEKGATLSWHDEAKFPHVPFCVFAGFNHGSIIDPAASGFLAAHGPGTLALEALRVGVLADYEPMAQRFQAARDANYAAMEEKDRGQYQQFFFRVRDDVDLPVADYFLDFHVIDRAGHPHRDLTLQFDQDFEASFYRHSADPAYRVMMVNCSKLQAFGERLAADGAKLVVDITGVGPLPDVTYEVRTFVVHDGAGAQPPTMFLHPNTTTLVDIVLDRRQSPRLLQLKDGELNPIPLPRAGRAPDRTGRAQLLGEKRP